MATKGGIEMAWLKKLFGVKKCNEPKKSNEPKKRNEADIWPMIVEAGKTNPDKENKVTYTLTETSLGNPISIQVTTQQYCVYCKHFTDPEFNDYAFPDGGGYCRVWNGAAGFKDSCKHWEPNTKVRYWLSSGYMLNNRSGYPKRPWYQVFDDGPDGEKGTR